MGFWTRVRLPSSPLRRQSFCGCFFSAYRHKGIGEELLKHAFALAKELNCTKMNIGIVEENQVLRKWYQDMGFVHVGTQKFDFFPFTCGYMEKEL